MLASWFERGLGQIVAPDEKAKSSSKEEREEGFWSVVAPDPRQRSEERVGPPPSAFLSPNPGGPGQVQCVNCNRWTPVAPSTPSPSAVTTPAAASATTPSALESLVLSAAKETAESMISPPTIVDARNKVFRLCASSKPLSDKLCKRLRRLLQQDPSLSFARASRLGNLVPDGYTPLMAAASVDHVVAAKVVSEESPESVNEVDLQGRTALHIAAELGCVEMVEFLKTMHPEGPDAPLDLTGHTPFGRAVTSQHKAAKKHQSQLQQKLFSPGDVSVCGRPTPAKMRSAELDLQLMYGYAEMPGFRVMMEDAISCHVWPGHALLGVCDGHGDGGLVSDFVSSEIANILKNQLAGCPDDVNAVWTTSCLSLDEKLKQTGRKGGSTAVWALVTAASVIVANVGDSRCILIHKRSAEQAMEQLTLDDGMVEERGAVAGEQCAGDEKNTAERNDDEQGNEVGSTSPAAIQPPAVKGEEEKSFVVTALSEDHKPNLEGERARIENSGLAVSSETFMVGENECTVHKVALSETDRLAVSRAFGDFEYKANEELPAGDQAVVAIPEIHVHHRDESRDMYLVLACDGVWDVMSNEEVGDFVVRHVEEAMSGGATDILPRVGDMLVNECLRRGSTDNMSVMVVALSKEAARLSGSPIMKGKALNFLD